MFSNIFFKKLEFQDNPLYCDEKLDWLVSYLVENQVRTFLPYQTEVLCAGPEKYSGVRLKELMIVKANETMSKAKHIYENGRNGAGKHNSKKILHEPVLHVLINSF